MNEILLELKNITKIYGRQKALDDVSFSIKKGRIYGFVGENGAGKTTALRIITLAQQRCERRRGYQLFNIECIIHNCEPCILPPLDLQCLSVHI